MTINDTVFTASTVFYVLKFKTLRDFVSCGRIIPVIYAMNSFCIKESSRKEGVRDSFCKKMAVFFAVIGALFHIR